MPTIKRKLKRVGIRLPAGMIDEVDRIVEKYDGFSYLNRQRFIESAISEKIESVRLVEQGLEAYGDMRLRQTVQESRKEAKEQRQKETQQPSDSQ